jgi:hypothetical protein
MTIPEGVRLYVDQCDDGLGCIRGMMNAVLIYVTIAIFVALMWGAVKLGLWVCRCL